ncbi:GrpB family protein [Mammaliicoccus sciuri]|uniref:GrpB family protein n=1 Tax=Mammaliicoccus sciuri TaxID=1296 RepID=UPI002DB93E72|nr:GrpB family protein [Mammaliicoccus sciuri]MEB7783060.1 GrpB family protein [Mammaliicoccus sciuri]
MQLGLKNDEIRLEKYTVKWHDEFIKVKNELLKYTQFGEYRIEHIGSTSIQGMSAKPIIDIVVGVDNLEKVDEELFNSFRKAGFLRLRVEKPNEVVLAKFTDETYQVKTHFIHLVEYQQEIWNNLTFFRDYLNSNEAARKEYLDIKTSYLKNTTSGIKDYTDFKEKFVKSIYNKRNAN